jgi:hypothetical protein
MDRINRLLVGNYNITQPYQTNNYYEIERTERTLYVLRFT